MASLLYPGNISLKLDSIFFPRADLEEIYSVTLYSEEPENATVSGNGVEDRCRYML